MKFEALTNIQLNDILRDVKNYNGCYSKDKLPNKLKCGFYIINLESYYKKNGKGTHWVCFYYSPSCSLYFDSMGFVAPE
jgi:hypothetical protein